MRTFAGTGATALVPGTTARVSTALACGWRSPAAPRAIDAPALAQAAEIRHWLAGLDDDEKRDLVGRLDTQLLLGDEVAILAIDGDWARVAAADQPTPDDARGYPVWLPVAHLAASPGGPATSTATVIAPTAELVTDRGALEVSFGTRLAVARTDASHVLVVLPDGGRGRIRPDAVAVHRAGSPAVAPSTESIVALARRFVGLPYLWAGTSGFGFDCSGLVHLVHRVHGITLPRDTGPQSETGELIDPDDRRAGDLVFFERGGDVHHVAMWVDDGLVIESPKTGLAVRVIALDELPYASEVTLTRRVV